MKTGTSRKVPDGFVFVDWEDNSGHIWRDVMPIQVFEWVRQKHNVTIKRVISPFGYAR